MSDSCFNGNGLFNDYQGSYENKPTKQISNIPEIDLAYLSNLNCMSSNESDSNITLNNITLNWSDFVALFFKQPCDAFYINSNNSNAYPISFYKQTYQSTQNNKIKFNLADQIIKAWSKKNNKPESSIPPYYKIMLNRNGFLTKSLASIKGYVMGLGLDEVISTLLSNGEIKVACVDDFATVNFTITYNDVFEPLETNILVYFKYTTFIPGYKNVSENNHNCYSNCVKPIRNLSNIKMNNTDFFDLDFASDICSVEENVNVYPNASDPNASDNSVNSFCSYNNKSVHTTNNTHKTNKSNKQSVCDIDMNNIISDNVSEYESNSNSKHNIKTIKRSDTNCDDNGSHFTDWDENKSTNSHNFDICDEIDETSSHSNVYITITD